MPCDYRIYKGDNLIVKTFKGRITYRCVLCMFDRIESDPDFRSGMHEFTDFRDVTDYAITVTDIGKFADLVRCLNSRDRQPTKKAFLAPSGPGRTAAWSFCKEMEDYDGMEVAVFKDIGGAARFLGISDDFGRRIMDWTLLQVH